MFTVVIIELCASWAHKTCQRGRPAPAQIPASTTCTEAVGVLFSQVKL